MNTPDECDAARWRTFKRLNDGGRWDMRRFIFDADGHNGHWEWIGRWDMNDAIDAVIKQAATEAPHPAAPSGREAQP